MGSPLTVPYPGFLVNAAGGAAAGCSWDSLAAAGWPFRKVLRSVRRSRSPTDPFYVGSKDDMFINY